MVNQRLDNSAKGGGVGSGIEDEFRGFGFDDVSRTIDEKLNEQQGGQNGGNDDGNGGLNFDDGGSEGNGSGGNDNIFTDKGGESNDGEKNDGENTGDENGDEGTDTGTIQEDPTVVDDGGFSWSEGGLYIALAVVVGLLVVLVADTLRRRKRGKGRARGAGKAPVTVTEEGFAQDLAGDAAGHAPVAQSSPIGAAVYQHIGAREDQQDSYGVTRPELYNQQGVLAVVADGMGGLANGKAVSSAIVRTFADHFPQISGYYAQPQDVLLDLTIRANAQVNQLLRGADRSGSTLVAALLRNGYLHFLTVGDSRIYLYRGGALLQLNREHIYQEELAVKAINQTVSMAQVRGDRQAHSLTSYVGIGRIPCIDRNDEGVKLVKGDRILMASDGVFGTLTQEQMEQALTLSVTEAAKTMGALIREADKPYQDNNTLVILEYKG